MRKTSNMGGGRFEFAPELLDKRHSIRVDVYASAYADVIAAIEQALNRADGDIVTRQGLEEYLGGRLVQEFIRRREGRGPLEGD